MSDPPQKEITVVIVEDNDAIAELIRLALSQYHNYQPIVVSRGDEALGVICSIDADLVLLDMGLPGLSGLQIFDILQDDPALRHIPIIFVTGSPDYKEFRKRNISDYILKPFDVDELLRRVQMVARP